MQQLLGGLVHVGGLAGVDRHLLALLELDVLAVLPRLRHTVGRLLHLAAKGVGHLGVGLRLWLVIPDLLQLVSEKKFCQLISIKHTPACPCR